LKNCLLAERRLGYTLNITEHINEKTAALLINAIENTTQTILKRKDNIGELILQIILR